MNASLKLDARVLTCTQELLNTKGCTFTQIGGGRNSRVYCCQTPDGERYAVKSYFRNPADPRDRGGTEFRALEFMWRHGMRQIPQPLAMNEPEAVALYGYLDGERLQPEQVTQAETDQLASFLCSLQQWWSAGDGRSFQPASEACFTLESLTAVLSRRQQSVKEYDRQMPLAEALHAFLQQDFSSCLQEATTRAVETYRSVGLSQTDALPENERTLSPSDYGFHNALLSPDGRLFILDFEYFGQDDPCKTVADFLLHPAMRLRDSLYHAFAERMCGVYATPDNSFRQRLQVLYPLYALKWCLILLNEFVPAHAARRVFSHGGALTEQMLAKQLAKANDMLMRARNALDNRESFPWMKP